VTYLSVISVVILTVLGFEILGDWWACANQISISKNIVDSSDIWEDLAEFVEPWGRIASFLPSEFVVPLLLHEVC